MPRAPILATFRFFLVVLVFLAFTPIYWVLLKINQPLGFRFGRFYLSTWRKCLGYELIIKGQLSTVKPTLYVANHSSYIDILVLGTFVPARFVSKDDVAKWPIMGWLATNQGTIYISRSRNAIAEGADKLLEFLDKGESLILFPEGTTSDSCRILPFGSSFFDVAVKKNIVVQPITVSYAGWDGLAMPRFMRKLCSWFSPDTSLLPHLWSLVQIGTIQVVVELHEPFNPQDFASRKELAQASFTAVQQGLVNAFASPISQQRLKA